METVTFKRAMKTLSNENMENQWGGQTFSLPAGATLLPKPTTDGGSTFKPGPKFGTADCIASTKAGAFICGVALFIPIAAGACIGKTIENIFDCHP